MTEIDDQRPKNGGQRKQRRSWQRNPMADRVSEGKAKKGKFPREGWGAKSSEAIHEPQYGERRKGQHSSVNKNKGNGKGQRQREKQGQTEIHQGQRQGQRQRQRQKERARQRQSMISTGPQTLKVRRERFQIRDHASSWLGRKTMRRETWRLSMRERRSLNRSKTSVVRRFKEIMTDASVRDWKNMAHFSNLRRSVHVYDLESKSARNPGLETEWSIVWPSALHRKHIFFPQKILETKHINDDAIRFTRRVKWA